MIVYSYTNNSLLQTIIHRTKEGRILMEKIQENVTRKAYILLGGKKREDFKKMAEKNPEMQEAYDMLDRMSADEKARLEYEARQKLIRDRNMILKTAQHRFEKGLHEGRETGLREGQSRINQLNVKLAELQRTEDILKAAMDEDYQKKLLKEFGL